MKKLWRFLRNLSLMQEIVLILVLKVLVIFLLWWCFFRGHYVEVTPETVLQAPALQRG